MVYSTLSQAVASSTGRSSYGLPLDVVEQVEWHIWNAEAYPALRRGRRDQALAYVAMLRRVSRRILDRRMMGLRSMPELLAERGEYVQRLRVLLLGSRAVPVQFR